jgi:HlyD family secretion protein
LGSAQENAKALKAGLDQATSRLQKTTIRAPIDGVVLSRLVEPGQTITSGFTTPVLFKLAQDLRRMRLNVDIDEADVSRIRMGQPATFTVESYPGRTFPSTVGSLQMDPKVSQNVVTYRAVLTVDNTGRELLPGMTCTATIQAEVKQGVLVVPNAALRFVPPGSGSSGLPFMTKDGLKLNDGKHRLWVLEGDLPRPIEVKPGASDGRLTEVVSENLREGLKVVTDVRERP